MDQQDERLLLFRCISGLEQMNGESVGGAIDIILSDTGRQRQRGQVATTFCLRHGRDRRGGSWLGWIALFWKVVQRGGGQVEEVGLQFP